MYSFFTVPSRTNLKKVVSHRANLITALESNSAQGSLDSDTKNEKRVDSHQLQVQRSTWKDADPRKEDRVIGENK